MLCCLGMVAVWCGRVGGGFRVTRAGGGFRTNSKTAILMMIAMNDLICSPLVLVK